MKSHSSARFKAGIKTKKAGFHALKEKKSVIKLHHLNFFGKESAVEKC